jgi:RNA polymerase sigma-70 factor (sigma-E family)
MPDTTFEEFVRASLPVLGRYAYALTGDPQAGEDLVQDTLIKVSRSWRRVRIEGNPVGYARTVMFRTHISAWRTIRRRPVGLPYLERPDEVDRYAAVEARDVLRRVLVELPALQQAVLVLGYLDDATDDEIAMTIGRRPATVRSLRHRALTALRARLADENDPSPAGRRVTAAAQTMTNAEDHDGHA